MSLMIGIPREIAPGEKRVATVPEVVEKLIKLGFKVAVESGAGDAANFSDDTYRAAGAEIIDGAAKLWSSSDIVLKVCVPTTEEVCLMREGGTLIDFIWPAQNPELLQQLAREIHRAQPVDAGAQEDGQQLGIGQGAGPLAQQLLSGTLILWPLLDAHLSLPHAY